jgi:hypothetical protein
VEVSDTTVSRSAEVAREVESRCQKSELAMGDMGPQSFPCAKIAGCRESFATSEKPGKKAKARWAKTEVRVR